MKQRKWVTQVTEELKRELETVRPPKISKSRKPCMTTPNPRRPREGGSYWSLETGATSQKLASQLTKLAAQGRGKTEIGWLLPSSCPSVSHYHSEARGAQPAQVCQAEKGWRPI